MKKRINLSVRDQDELVGDVYDSIESKAHIELNNDDYDKIQNWIASLLDDLNGVE